MSSNGSTGVAEASASCLHGGEEEACLVSVNKGRSSYDSVAGIAGSSRSVGLKGVCFFILIVELCERLAFYTFIGTQEPFLESGGYTLSQSAGINCAMTTLCMTWSLLACWTADVSLGRYNTILYFGILYAVGSFLAAVAAWPSIRSMGCYLFAVMVLVPLGTAGIKANISNFGADQYDVSDPEQAEAQEKFFSWFYLSINLGSAVSYGYLTTLGSNGGLGVPKSHGYFAAYAIAAACMLMAVVLFRSGKSRYQMRAVQERWALCSVARYVVQAGGQGSRKAVALCVGCLLLLVGIALSVCQAMWPQNEFTDTFMYGAFVCTSVGIVLTVLPCLDMSWLENVRPDGETFSNSDVRKFLSLLPILITANLAFGAVYNSMQYWYQQQACQMDLRIPLLGGQFAGSFFMIADCLGIVVATPLALGWLNPMLDRKLNGRFGFAAKYGLGMALGVTSVALAARFEVVRRSAEVLDVGSNCSAPDIYMSAMSASWMIVPFFLMGLGEIYTQPVLMHFAYTRSPRSMQTLVVAVSALIGAVSNGVFTVQIAAMSAFVPNDLNQGHLEFGYLSNIIVALLLYVAFAYCAQNFPEEPRANALAGGA